MIDADGGHVDGRRIPKANALLPVQVIVELLGHQILFIALRRQLRINQSDVLLLLLLLFLLRLIGFVLGSGLVVLLHGLFPIQILIIHEWIPLQHCQLRDWHAVRIRAPQIPGLIAPFRSAHTFHATRLRVAPTTLNGLGIRTFGNRRGKQAKCNETAVGHVLVENACGAGTVRCATAWLGRVEALKTLQAMQHRKWVEEEEEGEQGEK